MNPHHSPSSPRTQSTFANNPANISYSAYSPSNQYDNHVSNQYQQQPASHHYYQPPVNETPTSYQYHPHSPTFHQSKVFGSPTSPHSYLAHNSPPQMTSPVSAAPPPPPPPPPPPAPPLPSSFNAPNSYRESNIRVTIFIILFLEKFKINLYFKAKSSTSNTAAESTKPSGTRCFIKSNESTAWCR